jgi:outer membrane lipoprotein-sorting protein
MQSPLLRNTLRSAAALLLGCCCGAGVAGMPAGATADRLLALANAHVHFPDSTTTLTMQVTRDGRIDASYGMLVNKLDSDRMRIDFTEPAREKGRKILRVGDKMWMFLPDLGKPIVLSARQSFLGSTFSNADLLRTDLVVDYSATLDGEHELDGVATIVLELRARNADVAYERIRLWIDKASSRPLREDFFTVSGKRIKSLVFSKPAHMGGVDLSTVVKVDSDLNPRESTTLTISALAVHQKLSRALFQKDSFAR